MRAAALEAWPLQKVVADARARAALLGAELHELRGDDGRPEFVLTRGPFTRVCKTLRDVDHCLAGIDRQQR